MGRRRRLKGGSDELNYWQSYSDMMAGLLLMFVLIMVSTLLQSLTNLEASVESYNAQTQELLTAQTELEAQRQQLVDLEVQLLLQQEQYSLQEEELSEAQLALIAQQLLLDEQTGLLAEQREQFNEQSLTLQIAQALLAQKQQQLDSIVGIRADIIGALSLEFSDTDLHVTVDTQTGAITFDSSVLFDTNESKIKDSGIAFLKEFIPIYLGVVLDEKYADYLSEIIIEGHTDTAGTYIYNLQLSQSRAFAVAQFILEDVDLRDYDVDRLRSALTANGRSWSNPVYNDDSTVNMSASRRVEFKFRLKDDEMIQQMQEILGQTTTDGTVAVPGNTDGTAADAQQSSQE